MSTKETYLEQAHTRLDNYRASLEQRVAQVGEAFGQLQATEPNIVGAIVGRLENVGVMLSEATTVQNEAVWAHLQYKIETGLSELQELLNGHEDQPTDQQVDDTVRQTFPASDPPANY